MSGAPQRVVIIGAGQAGGQAAYSLRLAGYEGAITLIGDEPAPPYQRPPLSKAYFKGEMEAAVAGLGFEQVVIARPSLLAGDRASLDQPSRSGEKLALWLSGSIAGLIPKRMRPIDAATVAALQSTDVQQRYGPLGLEVAPLSPAAFGDFIRNETRHWGAAIREAGIQVE